MASVASALPDSELVHYPGHYASIDPGKAAIVMHPSGQVVTYGELDDFANRLSRLLRAQGLQVGDHVALLIDNRAEFLETVWGCQYGGLYYTPISTRLTADEIAYIVNDCGARIFIASTAMAERAAEIIEQTPDVDMRLSIGGPIAGHESLEDAIAAQPDAPLDDRREGQDMLYSSGTTGQPKGVKIALADEPLGSSNGLLAICRRHFAINEGCRYLSPAPLYHGAPLGFCRNVHRMGGTTIIMEHFDAEEALVAIERHAITTSQWVPTMFVRMLKLDETTRSSYDVSSLEVAVHAAAPIAIGTKEAMIDWWGPVLHEYYAGTERNGFTHVDSEDWLTHRGTVGRSLRGEIHILGDDGDELPVGEIGGIYFANGSPFEYHNDPEKTRGTRNAQGWTTMGDIGRVDEGGFLYLTDRKAFTIISGGVNIYPQEAENLLTMHPAVIDVAVFGIPNEDFGEEVKAVVQPAAMPATPAAAEALESELIAYCRANLADVKCPRSVDFRAELPRLPTGKLFKRLLRDEYR